MTNAECKMRLRELSNRLNKNSALQLSTLETKDIKFIVDVLLKLFSSKEE